MAPWCDLAQSSRSNSLFRGTHARLCLVSPPRPTSVPAPCVDQSLRHIRRWSGLRAPGPTDRSPPPRFPLARSSSWHSSLVRREPALWHYAIIGLSVLRHTFHRPSQRSVVAFFLRVPAATSSCHSPPVQRSALSPGGLLSLPLLSPAFPRLWALSLFSLISEPSRSLSLSALLQISLPPLHTFCS